MSRRIGGREGARVHLNFWERGAQVARPESEISEWIVEARASPNSWEEGHKCPSLSDISEWIKVEGQGIRGHMSLLTF